MAPSRALPKESVLSKTSPPPPSPGGSAKEGLEIDQREFRQTMSQFCTGVVIATGAPGGVPAGFAAQSFVSVSLDPPLIALSPAKTSSSWPKLRDAGAFCINVLGADQEALCNGFAKPGGDKFADLTWRAGNNGAPRLEGMIAYVECQLQQEVDAGDHTIAIARVTDIERADTARAPLLFFRGGYGEFLPFTESPS